MGRRTRFWLKQGRRMSGRLLAYGLLWLVLTGGDFDSWVIGAPFLLAALLIEQTFPERPAWQWRPLALLGFLPFFLASSLRAGLDVAWRTFHPARPLRPALLDYRWRLEPGPARVLLANTLTLLPGTLSVHATGDRLVIHTLDRGRPVWAEVQQLEARIGRLFRSPVRPGATHG